MLAFILVAVIILQSFLHFIERRDMYNRLMSKNLSEYKQGGKTTTEHIPSAHSRVLSNWRKKAGDR